MTFKDKRETKEKIRDSGCRQENKKNERRGIKHEGMCRNVCGNTHGDMHVGTHGDIARIGIIQTWVSGVGNFMLGGVT